MMTLKIENSTHFGQQKNGRGNFGRYPWNHCMELPLFASGFLSFLSFGRAILLQDGNSNTVAKLCMQEVCSSKFEDIGKPTKMFCRLARWNDQNCCQRCQAASSDLNTLPYQQLGEHKERPSGNTWRSANLSHLPFPFPGLICGPLSSTGCIVWTSERGQVLQGICCAMCCLSSLAQL